MWAWNRFYYALFPVRIRIHGDFNHGVCIAYSNRVGHLTDMSSMDRESPPPPYSVDNPEVASAPTDASTPTAAHDDDIPAPEIRLSKLAIVKSRLSVVTVEPILFLFMFSAMIMMPTVQALIYRKTCRSSFNLTVCDNLEKPENAKFENIVQERAARWFIAENFCYEIPSIFTSFIYGNLSDRVNRKWALILPLIGQMISSMNYVINSCFLQLPIALILVGPLVSGCFGGWIGCTLASFSYISEISTSKTRTFRIAIGEGVTGLSVSLAFFLGGFLLDKAGYTVVFVLAFCLYSVGLVYTYFAIRNPVNATHTPSYGCCQKVKLVLSPRSIKESVLTVFKKRTLRRRSYILVLCGFVMFSLLAFSPVQVLAYLYLKRQPLSWSQTFFGYFMGFGSAVQSLSLVLILPLLKRILRMRETSIMLLVLVMAMAAQVLFGFSITTWMVFLVPVVNCLSSAGPVCARSLISQMVDRHEFGQVFAVFGSINSFSTLMASLMYNSLYSATLPHWAGTSFMVGAALSVIPFSLLIWMHLSLKGREEYSMLQVNIESDMSVSVDVTNGGQHPIEDTEGARG